MPNTVIAPLEKWFDSWGFQNFKKIYVSVDGSRLVTRFYTLFFLVYRTTRSFGIPITSGSLAVDNSLTTQSLHSTQCRRSNEKIVLATL